MQQARVARMLVALLAAAAHVARAGPLDSYMVGPASYWDVVHPPPGSSSSTLQPQSNCTISSSSSGDSAAETHAAGADAAPGCAHHDEAGWRHGMPSSSQQAAGASSATRLLLQAPAANPARLVAPYNVCVSSWVPMVRCSPGDAQADFKGYQIELFRMLAKEAGLSEADYAFTCLGFSDMLADLQEPAGSCSLSAAGIEVLPEHIAAGLKFSWPTYKSGLRVMIHTHLQSGSTWAFAEIFDWRVWLLLGGTAVAVGLLIGVLELANSRLRGYRWKGWQSWQWDSLAKMMHVVPHVGDPGSDASRVLMLGYGFLVLVMVSMYTAVAASRLTASKLTHPVHGKEDLAGPDSPHKAQTWSRYVAPLARHHNITAAGQAWERDGDLRAMIERLKDGTFSALVLDAPVLEHAVGTSDECDLFLVGDAFESFSLALAFPPGFPDATIFELSKAIVRLQTFQGALDMLESVYIKTGGASKCLDSSHGSGGHGNGETIELQQVSGLWYILAISVGVAFVLTLARNVRKQRAAPAASRMRRFGSFLGINHEQMTPGGHHSADATPFASGAGGAAGAAGAGAGAGGGVSASGGRRARTHGSASLLGALWQHHNSVQQQPLQQQQQQHGALAAAARASGVCSAIHSPSPKAGAALGPAGGTPPPAGPAVGAAGWPRQQQAPQPAAGRVTGCPDSASRGDAGAAAAAAAGGAGTPRSEAGMLSELLGGGATTAGG